MNKAEEILKLVEDSTIQYSEAGDWVAAAAKLKHAPKDALEGYLECALWSSTHTKMDGEEEGETIPLDSEYGFDDFSKEALDKAVKDLDSFWEKAEAYKSDFDSGHEFSKIGHDFWLTREGHGAGFWDGDYEDELGKKLTEISKSFGNGDIYVGDDNLLYFG